MKVVVVDKVTPNTITIAEAIRLLDGVQWDRDRHASHYPNRPRSASEHRSEAAYTNALLRRMGLMSTREAARRLASAEGQP